MAIAAVVVVPFTLLQYLLGDQVRTRGEEVANGVVIETATWALGIAGLVAALAGVVMFLVLTGAITRRWRRRWPARIPGWSRATASASIGSGRSCWSVCWSAWRSLGG